MSAPVLSALVLFLAAGAAAPTSAQSSRTPAPGSAVVASTVDFRSSQWLSKRRVVNNNGGDIADVADLIVDRGSGRIEYIVVKTGSTLGMGGREVAIPFGSFRWEASGKDRFVLASTAEQLKQFPEYTAESWKAIKEVVKDDNGTLRQRMTADAASPSDPYAGNLDTATKSRVEGEITKVERVRTSTFGEQVVITVATADASVKRIALGPSWYINGSSAAPMRGDKVVVETLALPRDPEQLLAGTELRNGQREMHLRGTDGSPAWALKTVESGREGGTSYSTPYARYLLLSDLPGMKVDCRGNECGKVYEIILDRNSGEIGFLSIDPNQNFLGIGDTKRLIPWSVATVMVDGTVRIDASKEMVLASPGIPNDLSTLNNGTNAERVYKAFEVAAPKFEAPKAVSVMAAESGNPWSAHGTVVGAIDRDSGKTISGKLIDIIEIKFEKGTPSARALKLHMPGDGGEETVLLGPAKYMDNQKPGWQVGDSIKVDMYRTSIDGQGYWIARSIDCKGAHAVLLDGNNAPVWAQQ